MREPPALLGQVVGGAVVLDEDDGGVRTDGQFADETIMGACVAEDPAAAVDVQNRGKGLRRPGWFDDARLNVADMINDVRRQGLEVSTADAAFTAGGVKVAAGDYVIRADQPYRTLADLYFSVQPRGAPTSNLDDSWLDFFTVLIT